MPCVFKINFQLTFPIVEFVRILRKGAMKEGPAQMQREFFSSINKYIPTTLQQNLQSVSPSSGKMWQCQRPADSLADCHRMNFVLSR